MIDFTVARVDAELVADTLWELGVVAIEERDAGDELVTLRTSMGNDPTRLMEAVAESFPHVTVAHVQIERAVADTWREFAEPTWVTDSVALVPAWIIAPSECTAIFVEPLDTFGLGNHATTVLALRLALRHVPRESSVFDLGSGSGVLAIALAKVNNCSVQVFDIAESAREALTLNAEINSITSVDWCHGYPTSTVDAVVANILAPVLIAESHSMSATVRTGGVVVLSGMRTEQVQHVLASFPFFTELDRESEDGWTAVVLQKTR